VIVLYLDTSAVVKLYSSEPGSAETRRAVREAVRVASSSLTYAETRAAFARKRRLGQLDDRALLHCKQSFETDWREYFEVLAEPDLIRRAGELAESFGLRAYDAVQLASVQTLERKTQVPLGFCCFDSALRRAATALGFQLIAG
jgi:predicted nucleic acid-binding protein